MGKIGSIPDNVLKVDATEKPPQLELFQLFNDSQAYFYKLFLSAKYPEASIKTMKSKDYPEELGILFTAELPAWFQKWWTEQEKSSALNQYESPEDVGRRAYKAFRNEAH